MADEPMPDVPGEERFKALMRHIFDAYYVPLLDRHVAVEVARQLEKRCPSGSAAPGAPSESGSPSGGCVEATCLKCGAAVTVPVPRPAMLKVWPPSGPASIDVAGADLRRIDEALSALERLGGDAPHRAIAAPERMKALFWMVAREVATRAYQGAWNQATDGESTRPMGEHHFKAFTRSVIDGQVPREWEPKP